MDINLDIQDNNEAPKKINKKQIDENPNNQTTQLADLDIHEISKAFTAFKVDNRHVVIPIGFPQAGKSLLLSSLMNYAQNCPNSIFKITNESKKPFKNGQLVFSQMIEKFKGKDLYEANAKGSLDLIGINIKPEKTGYPSLNLGFLDLAGEDIKNIKTSEGGVFSDKINAIFNGLKIDNTPIIFTLITPFEPAILDGESIEDAHKRESTLHYDFLNYIEVNQPQLLKNSKFFIIVSQWDKNPNPNSSVEEYISEFRPAIYNFVKNMNVVVWGEYSIGQLLVSKVNGVNIQEVIRENHDYPHRYWKKLYHICTGKNLDHKTWFEKLFG